MLSGNSSAFLQSRPLRICHATLPQWAQALFFAFFILLLWRALLIKAMNAPGFKVYSNFSISVLLALLLLWSISGYVQQQLFYFIGLIMSFLAATDDETFNFIGVKKNSE